MALTIKDSLIIWALLLVTIFLLGFLAGLRLMAALAFASLIAIIALTTFYPVTNFSSLADTENNEEVRIYFIILVVTVAYLFFYLCNKILADKRYVYFNR